MTGRGDAQRLWPLMRCTSRIFLSSFTQRKSTENSTRLSFASFLICYSSEYFLFLSHLSVKFHWCTCHKTKLFGDHAFLYQTVIVSAYWKTSVSNKISAALCVPFCFVDKLTVCIIYCWGNVAAVSRFDVTLWSSIISSTVHDCSNFCVLTLIAITLHLWFTQI